jgi:hypothetical protein
MTEHVEAPRLWAQVYFIADFVYFGRTPEGDKVIFPRDAQCGSASWPDGVPERGDIVSFIPQPPRPRSGDVHEVAKWFGNKPRLLARFARKAPLQPGATVPEAQSQTV